MKGNDGTGNVADRDDWRTPFKLYNVLNKQYGFVIDCCASKENRLCPKWYDNFESCDFITYNSPCWMNPPFSKAKEMFTHFFKVVQKGVAIYRCDNMETAVWQDLILKHANWVFIPNGRVSYEGKSGKGSRFPSALIGVGIPPPKSVKGTLLWVERGE